MRRGGGSSMSTSSSAVSAADAVLYASSHSVPPGKPFVVLHTLQGHKLTIGVSNKCRVRHVVKLACQEARIAQSSLFGVAVRVPSEGIGADAPRNEFLFLEPDHLLHKYTGRQSRLPWVAGKSEKTKRLVLYLRVTVYIDDIRLITCCRALEHYYLQLRENMADQWASAASVSEERAWEMASLAVIADRKDREKTTSAPGPSFLRAEPYFPMWLLEARGIDFVQKHLPAAVAESAVGTRSREDAIRTFCQEAARTPFNLNAHVYGMRRHKMDTVDRALLSISATGISVSVVGEGGERCPLRVLSWSRIARLSFERRRLLVVGVGGASVQLWAASEEKARRLLALCRAFHQTLIRFSLSALPRISEHAEKSVDDAISASTSGVVSDCGERRGEDEEEDVEEEMRERESREERVRKDGDADDDRDSHLTANDDEGEEDEDASGREATTSSAATTISGITKSLAAGSVESCTQTCSALLAGCTLSPSSFSPSSSLLQNNEPRSRLSEPLPSASFQPLPLPRSAPASSSSPSASASTSSSTSSVASASHHPYSSYRPCVSSASLHDLRQPPRYGDAACSEEALCMTSSPSCSSSCCASSSFPASLPPSVFPAPSSSPPLSRPLLSSRWSAALAASPSPSSCLLEPPGTSSGHRLASSSEPHIDGLQSSFICSGPSSLAGPASVSLGGFRPAPSNGGPASTISRVQSMPAHRIDGIHQPPPHLLPTVVAVSRREPPSYARTLEMRQAAAASVAEGGSGDTAAFPLPSLSSVSPPSAPPPSTVPDPDSLDSRLRNFPLMRALLAESARGGAELPAAPPPSRPPISVSEVSARLPPGAFLARSAHATPPPMNMYGMYSGHVSSSPQSLLLSESSRVVMDLPPPPPYPSSAPPPPSAARKANVVM